MGAGGGVPCTGRASMLALASHPGLRFAGQVDVFFSASVETGVDVLVHTMWKAGFPACKLTVRTTNPEYALLAWQACERALKL